MTSITSLPSASLPLTGTERLPMDQTVGSAVAASALVVGTGYRIESLGTTNWTACGLPAGVTAEVGLTFVCTAAGTGTGTAIEAVTVEATAQDIADLASATAGTDLSYNSATRLLSSSTGSDVTLPLVSNTVAGLMSSAQFVLLSTLNTANGLAQLDAAGLLPHGLLPPAPVRVTVRNVTGASISIGTPVYITGSSGVTILVAPANASTEATAANTLGIVEATIAHNSTGVVITSGLLAGISTAGLTEGAAVWLSTTTGQLTSTRPTQPAHGVLLGFCVKTGSGTSGILFVQVRNGWELDELHDVLITSPATGQVLRRASDGLWRNAQLSAADISGLGSAATTEASAYATAAQGTKADSAVQPAELSSALTSKADLVGGVIPSAQIPAIAITAYLGAVSSQSAMLALVGQQGDWCLRTDSPNAGQWILSGEPSSLLANWVQIPTATHNQPWNTISNTPTTLAGYGITDAITAANAASTYQPLTGNLTSLGANAPSYYLSRANHTGTQAWNTISNTPTTLAGYGITDGGGPPAGSTGQVQYCSLAGAFAGASGLVIDPTTGRLILASFVAGSAPAIPASGFTLYANSSNALSWIGANGFRRTLDATASLADLTWGLPSQPGTFALASSLGANANALARVSGTTGTTVQGSDLIVDDYTASTQANIQLNIRSAVFSCTATASDDFIAATGHTFIDGQQVAFSALTGGTGLVIATRYFVRDAQAGVRFRVAATSGGTAIDITTDATAGTVNLATAMGISTTYGGAFYLGPKPDNTAVGGNARGFNAIDLQYERTIASHVASGNYSVILNGSINTASGVASIAGGTSCVASGSRSIALGFAAVASRTGTMAFASGAFVTSGDVERLFAIMRNKTTNATPTELFLDSTSARLTVPAGRMMSGIVDCNGIRSDGAVTARYRRMFSIKNVLGTTTLEGTVQIVNTDYEGNAATDIAIDADDTNDTLRIRVTGIAGETWRWSATVDWQELVFGT